MWWVCHCVLVSGRMWRMLSPASWYISSSTGHQSQGHLSRHSSAAILDIFKIWNGNMHILKVRAGCPAPQPVMDRVASDGQSRQCRAQIRGQVSEQRSPGEEKRNALCRNLWENMENSPQSSAIQLDQKLRDHRLNCVGLRTGAPGSQHFPPQARDIQAAGSFLPLLIHFIVRV